VNNEQSRDCLLTRLDKHNCLLEKEFYQERDFDFLRPKEFATISPIGAASRNMQTIDIAIITIAKLD
jgi:hypothetical protein